MQVHAKHSILDPATADHVPARERSVWFGSELCLEGSPLASAQYIPASEVSKLLHACGNKLALTLFMNQMSYAPPQCIRSQQSDPCRTEACIRL